MGRKKKVELLSVKVCRANSKAIEVNLEEGATVQDALEVAEINPKRSEVVRIDGDEVEMDYEVEDGDIVTIVRNIEGGR
jgi:sulfur carrier protein ThiS